MREGMPIVMTVTAAQPAYVDTDMDAVVGWSQQLTTTLHRSRSVGSMVRGGSGEAVQLMLQGEGFVIVQPGRACPRRRRADLEQAAASSRPLPAYRTARTSLPGRPGM
ncbi:uncharacterized protein (AIM24 family) [Streptomyces sp. PvR018]